MLLWEHVGNIRVGSLQASVFSLWWALQVPHTGL